MAKAKHASRARLRQIARERAPRDDPTEESLDEYEIRIRSEEACRELHRRGRPL